eukprot:tig00000823_g4548.t1
MSGPPIEIPYGLQPLTSQLTFTSEYQHNVVCRPYRYTRPNYLLTQAAPPTFGHAIPGRNPYSSFHDIHDGRQTSAEAAKEFRRSAGFPPSGSSAAPIPGRIWGNQS